MRILSALLLSLTTLAPAFANSVDRIVYVSSDGERYVWNTTADGVVFVAPETALDDLYLLSPDCVVQNQTHGTGSWGWEDDAWQISFGLQYQITFPGPLPPVDPANCMMLR